jgi:NAD+ synthetase
MLNMKIGIAQVNTIVGDFSHNFNRITHFAEQAKALLCDLVVFSELVVSGYPSRDLLEKKDFIEANLTCLNKLVDSIRGIGVICGYVDKSPADEGNPLFNSAALFENGAILHKVNKRLLPTYDIFDEGRYFEPGTQSVAFPYHGRQIGLTICEDVWNDKDIFKRRIYHSDPVNQMIVLGADLIVNISASPFYVGKKEFRQQMLGSIARKYGALLIYANQVGGNDSVLFDGISCAFDQKGNLVARAKDFREDLVVFDTDDNSGEIHEIAASDPESIFRALVMGTHDYVAKCGFSKVVVGLSGGIDSALTACIAVEALGKQNVLTVFMPSRYTSKDNYEDTRKLARNLDVELLNIPIDSMLNEFVRFLSPSFSEENPGVVEQNLQARIRGTILMALSNKYGSLLLSTGNKSELAVGYCTLYGDMSGGLAVISDVPKTVIYKLAHYFNSDKDTIPERILHKAPSAELKPGQTDQDDLPPYEALDPILKSYIEDFKGADELVKMGFDKTLVKDIIQKVDRNEYKRHQAAPGLKVTSKAFGYGRRYPIAQRFKSDLV